MDDYESTGVMKGWDDQVRTTNPDDTPDMGYDANLDKLEKKEKKKAKKALKKHKNAMCELKLAVASNIISNFPFGRI